MDDKASRLKAIKERFEPVVWLVTGVGLPAIAGITLAWTAIIRPQIDQYFTNITNGIRDEIKQAQSKNEDTLSQIKNKLVNELDSTYYVSKSYYFSGSNEDQEPLVQFFYLADNDEVHLFIWSSGRTKAKMLVSINGGKPMGLQDFKANSWTDLNITTYVKEAQPLETDTFTGIGPKVHQITIIPDPQKIEPRRAGLTNSQIKSGTTTKTAGAIRTSEQQERPESDLQVYALLIIKRSPFK